MLIKDLMKMDASHCVGWSRRRGQKKKCTHRKYPDKATHAHSGRWVVMAIGRKLLWILVGKKGQPKIVKDYPTPLRHPKAVFIHLPKRAAPKVSVPRNRLAK